MPPIIGCDSCRQQTDDYFGICSRHACDNRRCRSWQDTAPRDRYEHPWAIFTHNDHPNLDFPVPENWGRDDYKKWKWLDRVGFHTTRNGVFLFLVRGGAPSRTGSREYADEIIAIKQSPARICQRNYWWLTQRWCILEHLPNFPMYRDQMSKQTVYRVFWAVGEEKKQLWDAGMLGSAWALFNTTDEHYPSDTSDVD